MFAFFSPPQLGEHFQRVNTLDDYDDYALIIKTVLSQVFDDRERYYEEHPGV